VEHVSGHPVRVRRERRALQAAQGGDAGGEGEPARVEQAAEGLDAERVAGQEDLLVDGVRDGQGEVAEQVLRQGLAPAPPGRQHQLDVGRPGERAIVDRERRRQLRLVVEAAPEGQRGARLRTDPRHLLVAGRRAVEDALLKQVDRAGLPEALAVGLVIRRARRATPPRRRWRGDAVKARGS
jgi:hypothetical protein